MLGVATWTVLPLAGRAILKSPKLRAGILPLLLYFWAMELKMPLPKMPGLVGWLLPALVLVDTGLANEPVGLLLELEPATETLSAVLLLLS